MRKTKNRHFFSSIHVKIATVFTLLLLVFVEIVGAIFIRGLEETTINNFETITNEQVEMLANNLGMDLSEHPKDTGLIQQRIIDFTKNNILEVRVINNKGIILASTSKRQSKNNIGQKNEYGVLNDLIVHHAVERDPQTNRRIYTNVQPIYSTSGDTVIGAIYVESDLERQYEQVLQTTIIFLTAALIAMGICLIIAIFVSRQLTKPIDEMQKQAQKIARGDYSSKVKVYGNDELGQLGATFNELSDRVEESQEVLEGERHRLDSILRHMTDGVIATDRHGRILIINEMAQQIMNTTLEKVEGTSILDFLGWRGTYRLKDLFVQESSIFVHREFDGVQTILKADLSIIRQENGFVNGLVCVLHDVTEQEKNEEERRNFVSNVSHELRTPLTSMRSYLEALNDGAWQDSELAPQFLKVTQEETERMIRMISDLLNLSRMDAGRSPLNLEMIQLNGMLNFILDRFDMLIEKEELNYQIIREFTRRDLFVEADKDKLMQVFDNILNNAMKYSPKGGTITIRLIETHSEAIVAISDEGMGIPKKDLGKVFDRFYRVDKARSREMGGTGLGLAISKEVIMAHGGKIWVDSMEGKGSTFFISLPYETFDEEEDWG